MIRISGCAGIALGSLVSALCVAYILAATSVVTWAQGLPVIGQWIMDVMQQVVYFPYAQYVFPLLGIFAIFWGVSIILKQSWARVVGAVLHGAGAFYVLAIFLVIVSLDEVAKVRWWIVLLGVLIVCYCAWMAYYFMRKDTQWAFAEKYYKPDDVDLPPGRTESQRISKPAMTVQQDEEAPVLARLIPVGDGQEPFAIKEHLINVGREHSHIVLDPRDTSISRRHAKILLEGNQFVLEDHSRNGTMVDGQKIKNDKIALPDGAEIQFGRHAKFTFEYGEQAKAAPDRPAAKEARGAVSLDPTDVKATVLARLEPLWSGGDSFDIAKPKVVIGRDPGACDLALPAHGDLSVSSKHAEIERTDSGTFVLRDLGSSNGTYVNDAKITEIELADGTEFRLGTGETRFRFTILSSGSGEE